MNLAPGAEIIKGRLFDVWKVHKSDPIPHNDLSEKHKAKNNNRKAKKQFLTSAWLHPFLSSRKFFRAPQEKTYFTA